MSLPAPLHPAKVARLALAALILALAAAYVGALSDVLAMAAAARVHAPAQGTLVVLGHRQPSAAPNHPFLARLQRAGRILSQDPGRPVILSGGATGPGQSEAAWGARILSADPELLPRAWRLEEHSRNTVENLRLSSRLAGPGEPLVVISSRVHLARVAAIARAQGLKIAVVAAEDAWQWSWSNALAATREAGYLAAWRLGWRPV